MIRPTRTHALGVAAFGLTTTVVGLEYWHVWRRGHAPLPAETGHVLGAGAEAARETVEVAVTGYKLASPGENALLNLLISYSVAAALVRLSTYSIRTRGSFGPFRDRSVGGRHIHHFLPGIGLAFLAGGASIVSRDENLDRFLAVPFGVGAALTLDEAALLVRLEDVYWSEEGIFSVQATLGTIAGLGALALTLRAMRRGEGEVLADGGAVEQRAGPA
ncbi:MAG: hypothetical protein ACR2NB_07875 [Solirubrobacteraceae bacterium]